jgi:hypothetical protein
LYRDLLRSPIPQRGMNTIPGGLSFCPYGDKVEWVAFDTQYNLAVGHNNNRGTGVEFRYETK